MTAAAAAGGLLAVVVPVVAVVTGPASGAAADEAAVLRLAAAEDADIVTAAHDAAAAEDAAGPIPVAGGMSFLASIVPVAEVRELEPPGLDVSDLLKAAGLADIVRKAQEERAAREAAAACDAGLGGLGAVKPWVRDAARFLSCLYDQPALIGVAQRARQSDHPSGYAVDLMTRGDQGDRIAECALRNQEELGVSYVIWRQRVNYGDGWEPMSDRGGDTANHYDHVHVSFDRSPPGGDPLAERCG